jgi:hypothetical protein
MMRQVIEILEGLEKPESVATGWVKDFDVAKEKVISHLVEGLSCDYLNADHSEKDSEADTGGSDSTAAGIGDSLQGEPPQGEVTEKDIQDLFMFDEEKIGTLSNKEKAHFEVAKQKKDMEGQTGNTGSGEGAPADEKLPSPYLAHATSPSLPPASASLDPSGLKESAGKYGDTSAPDRTESSSLLDTPSLISGDSKGAPVKAATQTEEERLTHSRIQQQLFLDGAGFENMGTPALLCSDVL